MEKLVGVVVARGEVFIDRISLNENRAGLETKLHALLVLIDDDE